MIASSRTRRVTFLLVVGLILSACGGPSIPGASKAPPGDVPAPEGSAPAGVGSVGVVAPVIDAADDVRLALARLDAEDRARARVQAGFATEVGSGWGALSSTIDAAIDAGVQALEAEIGIDVPISSRDRQLASIAAPGPIDRPARASSASAMAIVTAAMTAGSALGQGGTKEASSSETRTTTEGDDVATVTVKMKGKVTSSGSRVVAEFTFDLTGSVQNSVTGATAQTTGTATAHVEIDGCPDANGSSKGKMSLSSSESVSGQRDGGSGIAGWTRDLSGDFDIAVDDEANISGLVVDAVAQESVKESTREPGEDEAETHGHDLGVTAHYEYASGPGFSGLTGDMASADGAVTSSVGATAADLAPLFKSAAYAISVAAIVLGQAAESFWRDGKCVELIVDPDGGDVDANSITDVVAKVKHRFEGNELEVPVEATLAGVAAIDPAGERQPAPATVKYTAGPDDGDVGDVTFKTVSKRGIGKKTVKFTVRPAAWSVTFHGKDTEAFAIVLNTLTADIAELEITAQDRVLTGTGKLHLAGTVTSGTCSGPLDQVATISATGTLVGAGPEAVLRIVLSAPSPPGGIVHMTCIPGGGADIPAEGHSERFGEALAEFDLPATGSPVQVSRKASIGGIMQVAVSGTFTVTLAR